MFKRAGPGRGVTGTLSFGSETGRTRSGTKGFSTKTKKERRKKQDYHHKKAHFREEVRLDPEEVRSRTMTALDKLGHQVISTEPGGYDLAAWTKSVDALLHDFQEKVGPRSITDEFRARCQEILASLSTRGSSSDFDREIENLNREEATERAALAEFERKEAARRASLRLERDNRAKELKQEQEKLDDLKKARKSRSFLSKALNSGPSTARAEAKIAELQSKLKSLEEEIDLPMRSGSDADKGGRSDDRAKAETVQRLADVERRLADVTSAKQRSLQLLEAREVATKEISDMISFMKLQAQGGEGQEPHA